MGSLVAASLLESHIISITQIQRFAMEVDRSVIASDDHGSLLNKVYEMQCVREREIQLMTQSSLSQSLPVHIVIDSSSLLTTPVLPPSQANMMDQQVDGLTSAMTDMCMEEDSPESYMMAPDPYCQAQKRSDPVYMANTTTLPLHHHQDQQTLHQQLLLEQQQWIMQQQYMEQQQLAKNQEIQLQLQQTNQAMHPSPLVMDPPFKCEIGRGRILKRADLIPVQECPM